MVTRGESSLNYAAWAHALPSDVCKEMLEDISSKESCAEHDDAGQVGDASPEAGEPESEVAFPYSGEVALHLPPKAEKLATPMLHLNNYLLWMQLGANQSDWGLTAKSRFQSNDLF